VPERKFLILFRLSSTGNSTPWFRPSNDGTWFDQSAIATIRHHKARRRDKKPDTDRNREDYEEEPGEAAKNYNQ
jgi:hypothetical protein